MPIRLAEAKIARVIGHERNFTLSAHSPHSLALPALRDIVERAPPHRMNKPPLGLTFNLVARKVCLGIEMRSFAQCAT